MITITTPIPKRRLPAKSLPLIAVQNSHRVKARLLWKAQSAEKPNPVAADAGVVAGIAAVVRAMTSVV
jgi:hypothetical protein